MCLGCIFLLHPTKLTLLNYRLNVFMIHIELIKRKIKTTHLKNISVSCRNIKIAFSTMSHGVFYARIHVMDVFLDLMLGKECLSQQMTFGNLIYFPFHLGFQETHSKIQGLIVGISSSWILVNIHFFVPF